MVVMSRAHALASAARSLGRVQPELTLRQLTYFLAAAEHLSMTEAGRAAHVSQSAVSLAVADLERQLSTQLFLRHHAHGLSLTDAGRRIAPLARELLARANDLADEARDIGESLVGHLTVACYDTLAPFLVPRLITSFTDRHPQVELTFRGGNMAELHRLVRSGEAELMICYGLDLGDDLVPESVSAPSPTGETAPDRSPGRWCWGVSPAIPPDPPRERFERLRGFNRALRGAEPALRRRVAVRPRRSRSSRRSSATVGAGGAVASSCGRGPRTATPRSSGHGARP
jgi:DNA-binding transcriptional LysR family regulator